ncbi:unnamed protein product, partial [Sphacelaria rigidula]
STGRHRKHKRGRSIPSDSSSREDAAALVVTTPVTYTKRVRLDGYTTRNMHPAENTMPLPISTVGGHDDTTNDDAATPHSDRDGRAITPPSPSLSYAGDHEKPKPLAGNTIHDDPVGSVSSGSGGGDSASG